MENNNLNEKQKNSYKFSPEKAGMKDKFYPVYSMIFLAVLVKFLRSIFIMAKVDFKVLGYHVLEIPALFYTYVSLILLVIAVFKYIKLKTYINTTKYILTPQRLTIEKGFLSKSVSNLELWRVTDVQIKQTMTQKSFNSCFVQLITTDVSDPIINIDGLPYNKGRELYDILSEYVNDSIKNGGIMRTI